MLRIYRRHTRACTAKRSQHDRSFWNCRCTIHVEGRLGTHSIRESLRTRSRSDAQRHIGEVQRRGSWERFNSCNRNAAGPTIASAIAAFLTEAASDKGRELARPTLSKYNTLLNRLQAFCDQRKLSSLDDLSTEMLRAFRESWPTGPRATRNNLCRLRSFFRFCIENEWLTRNPALAIRGPKQIRDVQKLPFTEGEMDAILLAAREQGDADLLALILLMRHTGLRISDAVLLTGDRIQKDQLQLYTQKTGTFVSMPLAPELLQVLAAVQPKRNQYLFVSGSNRLETVTDLWRRKLNRVFQAASVGDATPHRFRHTFAVDLLAKGVDVKHVSMLLGHSSVTITEKFYAAWISSRQQMLSDEVRKTW